MKRYIILYLLFCMASASQAQDVIDLIRKVNDRWQTSHAGKKDAFIFMTDRWTPNHPIDGRYVWLPVRFENGLPVLEWSDRWDLSVFDEYTDNGEYTDNAEKELAGRKYWTDLAYKIAAPVLANMSKGTLSENMQPELSPTLDGRDRRVSYMEAFDAQPDMYRIHSAIRKIEKWYVGDGWYSDGEHFAFDYYNSYVIQPMYVQVLKILADRKMRLRDKSADFA